MTSSKFPPPFLATALTPVHTLMYTLIWSILAVNELGCIVFEAPTTEIYPQCRGFKPVQDALKCIVDYECLPAEDYDEGEEKENSPKPPVLLTGSESYKKSTNW